MIRAGVNIVDLLDKPYREFALAMNGLNFQACLSRAEFKRYHTELKKKLAGEGTNQECISKVRSLSTNMSLTDLSAGLVDPTGNPPIRNFGEQKEAADEDLVRWMEDGFNEQLRWILVSSFELYEKMVKALYAAVGFIDPDKWKTTHFGKDYAADASNEPLEWFEDKADKATKKGCKKVVAQLGHAFPEIDKCATTTKVEDRLTDLNFWRGVIEYFRHLIVHVRGTTKTEQFWKRIKEQTGCTFEGKGENDQRRKNSVQRFLESSNGRVKIELIDRSATSNPNHHGVDKNFRDLQKLIVDYTSLLYAVVIRSFGNEPAWNRDSHT